MQTIYLDYNATTPLDPAVREAMLPFLGEIWGNPSSVHHVGRQARARLDDARERAALVLGTKPSEIVFTGGGTESNNLAVLGTARLLKPKGNHLITSAIEHHAVLHACEYLVKKERFELTVLPVDSEGRVSPDELRAAIRPETILVSIMAANNEIGTIQPVAELGAICRERGAIFHTDAVQWFGKEPCESVHQFNADLVSLCGHKFHGPKGVGLLYVRSPLHPDPILLGGAHEQERRAGTENLAAICGLVTAMERFIKLPVFREVDLRPWTQDIADAARAVEGVVLVSPKTGRLVNTVAFVVEETDSLALLAGLDLAGVCASSGSACASGSLEPSHVVSALGCPSPLANALVRFSLGRENTGSEIQHVIELLPVVIRRAQRRQ